MSYSHVFTKNGTKYLFSMQTDSSRIIARSISLQFFYKKRRMAMSKEEREKEYDYQMRDKVALEEEASWAKLCSKLVNVYIKIVKK